MLRIGSNINEVRVDGNLQALRNDLAEFTRIGLTAAEISIHGIDAVVNGRLNHRRMTEIVSILRDFPFCYSTHAPNPLNLMDDACPEMHLDVLRASLEFSATVGAQCMVYHPGRFLAEEEFSIKGPRSFSHEERLQKLEQEAEILQREADAIPEVVITMENARPYRYHSPYCYAEMPHELFRQVERIDRPNVGMTLDFGHLNLSAHHYNFDALKEVSLVSSKIVHCHVHDNFGLSAYHSEKLQTHQIPFGRGDSHMPVGWGNINFNELLAPFIANYQGLLICELRSRYFHYTQESMLNLRAHIESLIS